MFVGGVYVVCVGVIFKIAFYNLRFENIHKKRIYD